MYTKIELNGMTKEVDVSELDFYCKCPKCGEEVAVPEFWELVQEESFDPFDSAVWCDDCHDLLNATRETVQGMTSALWNMPEDKVEAVYQLLAPYFNPEDE